MDTFTQADMIREALPNREGVLITPDCRVVFEDSSGEELSLWLPLDEQPRSIKETLLYLLRAAHNEGTIAGINHHMDEMRERLGL